MESLAFSLQLGQFVSGNREKIEADFLLGVLLNPKLDLLTGLL